MSFLYGSYCTDAAGWTAQAMSSYWKAHVLQNTEPRLALHLEIGLRHMVALILP